ncbi:trypsin-7-like [Agrilus planipennis]|uniref:Trypsin-7-like n=1 Tax=Agrilus planipennis TaxID=224129 RepID=A0A1W4XBM5_AGRPL|nr:trypsin-7-like [Agrilus planipennis]
MKLFLVLAALFVTIFGFPKKGTNYPLDGRIVGGNTVDIEEYPYQVSVLWWSSHICGGSLISTNWVITAAHCTQQSPLTISVRLGSSILNSGGTIVGISALSNHPNYDPWLTDYDISLLHLSTTVSLTRKIGVVGLPPANTSIPAGTNGIVTGWGSVKEGSMLSSDLQAVSVTVMTNEQCADDYGSGLITERMLCAGSSTGGRDACQGDSGGPLVENGVQIGIVSWGYGCARARYPGVYTNITNLRSYINEVSGL